MKKTIAHQATVPLELEDIDSPIYLAHIGNNASTLPCVYLLYNDSKLVYVGQSKNSVYSRLPEHSRKIFNKVFYIPTLKKDLDSLERQLIETYRPDLNIMWNPNYLARGKYGWKYSIKNCERNADGSIVWKLK